MTQTTETTNVPVSTGGMLARAIAMRQNKEVNRFMKFAVVGLIGAVIDSLTFNLLRVAPVMEGLQFHLPNGVEVNKEVEAGAIAFVLAVFSNFLWNRYWTYPDSRSKHVLKQLGMFFAINTFGLLIRAIVLQFGTDPLGNLAHGVIPSLSDTAAHSIGANLAWLIAVVIVMFWNFFVNRYLTYNDVN